MRQIHPDWGMTREEYITASRAAGLEAHADIEQDLDPEESSCISDGPSECYFANAILAERDRKRS